MIENDRDKLNRLEELKTKLFTKDYKPKIGRIYDFTYKKKREIPDSWGQKETSIDYNEKFFMKTSIFKKFFIFSILFFVIAVGFAAYMFFAGGNTVSNKNIDISILGNTFTAGGEELPLQVEIINKNNSALQLADLLVEYPKTSSGSSSQEVETFRQNLGTIEPGAVRNENLKLVLFGEQGSTRSIKISLEYRIEGSNSIFVKDKFYDVTISSAPINLNVESPNQISSNQEFNFKVKVVLNATKSASKILLKVDYPVGFEFSSATPAASFGNNIWSLGDLAPGVEKEISIGGKMVDVFDGEEKTFHVWAGSQSLKDNSIIDVVFNSLGKTIEIKKPFIQAKLYINGVYQREYVTNTKTAINGDIRWSNNLDTRINDLQIVAKISGNAIDKKTIQVDQGFYNSKDDTITWDKNTNQDFANVNPGDSGSLIFSFSPSSLFSAANGLLPDPSINIDVSIAGKQAMDGDEINNLNNSESKIVKIISDLGFDAKAIYFSGPFTNTGPIPPKVGMDTTYTIVWSLSNTANFISGAVVKSSLPPRVNFVGGISPSGENLVFNPSTRELIWNIGGVQKGAGITNADREVSFQVSINPSSSEVGSSPILVKDATLTGHDDFANVDVRATKGQLNTRLSSDLSFPADGDKVVE